MTQGGGGSSYDPGRGEDLHMTQGRGEDLHMTQGGEDLHMTQGRGRIFI